MARSTTEEEIRLRKRARRRLIGAIALTTLVVVTLPMVLDSEPRPIGDDIAVQIPSPNSGPYAPRVQGDASRSVGMPAKASGTVNAPPLAPADIPARPPPARAPASAASSATPADQKIEMAGVLRPPSDPGSAAAAATADARSAAEVAAAARAADAKAADAKAADAKAADAKAAEAKAAAVARAAVAADPRIATAKGADAKGADAKAAPGDAEAKNFVIQLGAFAEVNRAKDRHEQLSKAGVKAYTEMIKTPTGDKTRVRAGPFPTREAAEQANERLKGLGMTDGIVVPRRY